MKCRLLAMVLLVLPVSPALATDARVGAFQANPGMVDEVDALTFPGAVAFSETTTRSG